MVMQVNKPTRHTAIPSSGVSILGFCVLVRCGHVAIVVVVFFCQVYGYDADLYLLRRN